MLVKVLDENRVKILMEEQDIDQYDLPFEKIDYDDPVSKAFLFELIQKTYDETGMNFQDGRLMVEVIPGVSRSYYILLTRIKSDGEEKIEFDKTEQYEAEMYIFRVEHGRDVIRFFDACYAFHPKASQVYYYSDSYYITLSFHPHQISDKGFAPFIQHLEEYGKRCRYHYINGAILQEKGEKIISPNAYDALKSN